MLRLTLSPTTRAVIALAALAMPLFVSPTAPAAETPSQPTPAPVFDETGRVGQRTARSDAPSPNPADQRDSGDSDPGIWRAIGSLVLVITLIIAGTYALRYLKIRAARLGRNPGLEIVARTAINTKQSICLVKLGPRLLVVGVSPTHIAALDKIDDPDQITRITGRVATAAPDSIASDFAGTFQDESSQYDQPPASSSPQEFTAASANDPAQAHSELNSLLQKVKGLRRLCFRPNDPPAPS